MLFSAKQLHSYLAGPGSHARGTALHLIHQSHSQRLPSVKECGRILNIARTLLVSREETHINSAYLGKWLRPWDVVPELKNFTAPEGDYGVGIEVEFGFRSKQDAEFIANVIKNWRYIAMDSEGGPNGIEVTFAPMLYSKFDSTSQASRYLKLLKANEERLFPHSVHHTVGTHVNLSYAGYDSGDNNFYNRMRKVNAYVDTRNGWMLDGRRERHESAITREQQQKYFGREPYEGMNTQPTHVEFKLFNSVSDWRALRKYVNISVALLELIRGNTDINHETVVDALERGYNKA